MLPLVLLPGMMCDARLFGPQIAEFSSRRTICLPYIGGRETIEEIAADVLNVVPHEFALAGLSMGGIVAMEVLRQSPERVRKIALLDTNHLAELDEVKARRLPQIQRATEGGLTIIMRDEMKPNYLVDGPNRQPILDLCMDMAIALGPEVFVRQSRALAARRDQTETLASAHQPALVLCGRHDALCPIERHRQMFELLPNATFQIVENAGHLPTLEAPNATTRALLDWLEDAKIDGTAQSG